MASGELKQSRESRCVEICIKCQHRSYSTALSPPYQPSQSLIHGVVEGGVGEESKVVDSVEGGRDVSHGGVAGRIGGEVAEESGDGHSMAARHQLHCQRHESKTETEKNRP